MASMLRLAGGLVAAASVVAAETPSWLPDIITKDVAIIGGGASGAYAAVRLREDFNQSIVVVEKAGRLGGHVDTYSDPKTGLPFDFGVQSFNDYGPAEAFFQRMGVTVGAAPHVALTSKYVDFISGQTVNFTPPSRDDQTAALQRFLNASAPYENLTLPGYWNFPAPNKIPADLLLPFGQFVQKYNISAAVNEVFEVTGLGVGDMANEITMYVLQAFGAPMIRAFIGQGSTFTPASHRNIALYEAVASLLGSDVLYNTTVVQALRTPIGHTLWTQNAATNKSTIIIARKLLIAIEPTAENLAPFGLDALESSTLNKFTYSNVHAGIVSHPSLPVNVSLVNTPPSAAPSNYLALPKPNFNVRFDYMGSGSDLWRVLLVGNETFDGAAAQQLIRDNFAALVKAGTLPAGATSDPGSELQFRAWADHGAMHMRVSASELQSGFIQKLYGLQGWRETWWTGGAFACQFQAILWAFDDILLPKMLASF